MISVHALAHTIRPLTRIGLADAVAGSIIAETDREHSALHKESEKSWLAHLAEDQRYAAMAGPGRNPGYRRRACRLRRSASSGRQNCGYVFLAKSCTRCNTSARARCRSNPGGSGRRRCKASVNLTSA
jgi:hypothetical protein